jgi:phosphoribosylamine--glycine ligase
LVTTSLDEAIEDVRAKLSGRAFGEAGRRVVIEEGLRGPELSLLVLCDGRRLIPLPPARDYKRVGDGDTGPNTGGMGACSPVPDSDKTMVDRIMTTAIEPTLRELVKRGIDYRGVLYAGMMLTPDGPKVIEYNVRFGDPEAQVVLPRIETDTVDLFAAVAKGDLGGRDVRVSDDACVDVVLASEGYPPAPKARGYVIEGPLGGDGVVVYQAGTARRDDGALVTNGGRVLHVTGIGPSLDVARQKAYDAVRQISWPGMQYRTDIAQFSAGGST